MPLSKLAPKIPTQLVVDVRPADLTSRSVAREFRDLIGHGVKILAAGSMRHDPQQLLKLGQQPRFKLEIFDTRFYLTELRQIPEIRFYVAYIMQPDRNTGRLKIHARIIYKDLSLTWRAASHLCHEEGELWIGKGDVRSEVRGGYEIIESDEATTDMPLELQAALEGLSCSETHRRTNPKLLAMILRSAPGDRIEPYRDFSEPRRRAASNPANRINGGQSIARFVNPADPGSLQFVAGYEPDFCHGIVERSTSQSKLYGGQMLRFRILSSNKAIQYYFIAGPQHTWIFPPQTLTTELSSFGVRTISVVADDDLFLPGYEYHYVEETKNGPQCYSQIPRGFAGPPCPFDENKADASPWLDRIPIIQQFKQEVLKR